MECLTCKSLVKKAHKMPYTQKAEEDLRKMVRDHLGQVHSGMSNGIWSEIYSQRRIVLYGTSITVE